MTSGSTRTEAIKEVILLQQALEEMNGKLAKTRNINTALVHENETLSNYIDSLMKTVTDMGSLITSDSKTKARGLFGRRKVVKVNDRMGELRAPSASPSVENTSTPEDPLSPGAPSQWASPVRDFPWETPEGPRTDPKSTRPPINTPRLSL